MEKSKKTNQPEQKMSCLQRIVWNGGSETHCMAAASPQGWAASSGRYSGEVWDCLCHRRARTEGSWFQWIGDPWTEVLSVNEDQTLVYIPYHWLQGTVSTIQRMTQRVRVMSRFRRQWRTWVRSGLCGHWWNGDCDWTRDYVRGHGYQVIREKVHWS